ncbi:MAG: HD domain-containing protein [Phycisphaerales bacterium]|nr:HD domain-containing protein [Phycisphaerales bacterium]MCB9863665.1 HD domain-containing protein [Phycisphaerales bacterium]
MEQDGNELKAVTMGAARALARSSASNVSIYLPGDAGGEPVLYRGAGIGLPNVNYRRLEASGLDHLLIDAEELRRCERALESELADILFDPTIDANDKAACAQQVGVNVARDFLAAGRPADHMDRAARLVDTLIDGVLRDRQVAGTLLNMSAHHQSTASHLFAVGALSTMLAFEILGDQPEKLRAIAMAGMLHDLGKMSLGAEILSKSTPLTAEEMLLIRQHPIESVRLLGDDPNASESVRLMILQHHERFDGRGYPLGLRADEVELGSRIIAVTDAFHAMIGKRDYRHEFSPIEAVAKMRFQVGAQFDPRVFEAWENLFRRSFSSVDRVLDYSIDDTAETGPGYHVDHQGARKTAIDRKTPRHACPQPIKARCLRTGRLPGVSGVWGKIECPIRDVSRSGACIDLTAPMYRGEVVSVMLDTGKGEQWIRAVVRWCRRGDVEGWRYQAGIQFMHRVSAAEAHSDQPMLGLSVDDEVLVVT